MKKQFILSLCLLLAVSCTSIDNQAGGYSTLVDMFVWGDEDIKTEETHRGVKVSYKERLPLQTDEEKELLRNSSRIVIEKIYKAAQNTGTSGQL